MKNLIKSLSNFQNECPVIHKDTKGHNYTYADLPQIFSVINPLLKKNGLCFSQLLENDGIKTILFHVESGESLESFTSIPKVKLGNMNDFQAYGSGVTYFRRYCLSSMLALVTDKDLDAAGTQIEVKPAQLQLPLAQWKKMIDACVTIDELNALYAEKSYIVNNDKNIISLFSTKKLSFTIK
jgi:ERF superfamily